MAADKAALLKQYFGHHAFRPGQEALIDALLAGRDVLGVMPTGAGKSICYQLPALLLPGMTLVISPLISLMKDQVSALLRSGIPAAYLNSSLSAAQQAEVLRRASRDAYKLMYVAPERLGGQGFLAFAKKADIALLAVDEAHCVSQWGQDFRPSYLKIAEFVSALPRRPAIGAFTATATAQVKRDIEELIALENPLRVTTGFDRPNLHFDVARPKDKKAALLAFLRTRRDQSGIVYCATRKTVESLHAFLLQNRMLSTRYHAGLSDGERRQNQEDFIYDRARVMVATNAFGMGIDKSNVSFVVHYNMPKDIESYYQEAGRAGRDGEAAHCLLLFSAGDIQTAKLLIHNAPDNEELSDAEREAVRERDLQRLARMVAYCKTSGCLRAHLLRYFGESAKEHCGHCGNCNGEMLQRDITEQAQKILSAVTRVEQKYRSGLGMTLIVRMLHGSREQRVLQLGLDKLSTYGIMHDLSRAQIREYMDVLLDAGYLFLREGEYPVLRTTDKAKNVLFQGERVIHTSKKQAAEARRGKKPAMDEPAQPEPDLLSRLKALRLRLAQRERVPAYIVFSNAALTDMAAKQPQNMAAFLEVSGVGAVKAERYGAIFLKEIREWKEGVYTE